MSRAQCQNCRAVSELSELLSIRRYHERVAPGEPAGECPECGALAHEIEPVPTKTKHNRATKGCGETGPHGYACTHHKAGQHEARGTARGSLAEAWPIKAA